MLRSSAALSWGSVYLSSGGDLGYGFCLDLGLELVSGDGIRKPDVERSHVAFLSIYIQAMLLLRGGGNENEQTRKGKGLGL